MRLRTASSICNGRPEARPNPRDHPYHRAPASTSALELGAARGVAFVVFAVAAPAAELGVVEGGFAAVGPVFEVVYLTPLGGRTALRAALVAHDQRLPQPARRHPRGAPDIDHQRRTVGDHPRHRTITRQA